MAQRSMIMVKRTYLHIAVLTMVTAILWLAMTIYRSLISPSEIAIDSTITSPITPSFDEDVFNEIIGRENLSSLSFEISDSSASAVTINEVSPIDEVSSETLIETSDEFASESADLNTQPTEDVAP